MGIDPASLTLLSLILSVVALLTAILSLALRGTRFRARVETQLDTFNRTSIDILANSREILQHAAQLGDAAHHLRPELSTYLAHQWKFIEKTFRDRFEKHDICRRIVAHCLNDNESILLDSGSSVDLVTYELLSSRMKNINVWSNNVFAAIHLVGTKDITFHMFHGVFSDGFAATYSQEVNGRIRELPITAFVMAATAFRFDSGIMVDRNDEDNADFKRAAVKAFARAEMSKLIVAVDATKFVEPTERHAAIIPTEEWLELVNSHCGRITVVTAPMRSDAKVSLRLGFEQELTKFRDAGVRVDIE